MIKTTKEGLKAFRESKEHWRRLKDGDSYAGESIGSEYCALCSLYMHADCMDCPIQKYTGEPYCKDTPHSSVLGSLDEAVGAISQRTGKAITREEAKTHPKFQASSADMYNYLDSLEKKLEVADD